MQYAKLKNNIIILLFQFQMMMAAKNFQVNEKTFLLRNLKVQIYEPSDQHLPRPIFKPPTLQLFLNFFLFPFPLNLFASFYYFKDFVQAS